MQIRPAYSIAPSRNFAKKEQGATAVTTEATSSKLSNVLAVNLSAINRHRKELLWFFPGVFLPVIMTIGQQQHFPE